VGNAPQDVALIGASASGLLAALRLGQHGCRVDVYERASGVDPARRTLIVTSRMRHYVGDALNAAVVNQIRHFEMFADGHVASVTLGSPDLVVERSAVIANLAAGAQAAGADLHFGKRFVGLQPAQEGIDVHLEGNGSPIETIRAPTVIGADGAASRVARSAGWPEQKLVPLLQAVVSLPRDLSPDTARIWFCPQETPYFYWLIPQSDTRGALGLIGKDARTVRTHLDSFLARQGVEALEYQSARIPEFRRWFPVHRRTGSGRVFLVGDAAGHVKVSTVGGLVTGFRGAVAVVDQILGRGRRELRSLRRELVAHRLLRSALDPFSQNDYVRLLDLLSEPAVDSMARCSRDEALKFICRASVAQPRMVPLLLRGLLAYMKDDRRAL
jgi:flavin-dependent dehydrogenase